MKKGLGYYLTVAWKRAVRSYLRILRHVDHVRYFEHSYRLLRHRKPDFASPHDLSEYLIHDMLYTDFSVYAPYADKIAVRDYVSRKGLSELLPKVYGVWNSVSEIDFETLPQKFALKTNNGCGNHVLCRDKKTLDRESAVEKLRYTLGRTYNKWEPHYRHILPRVFCEELLENADGGEIADYKFMCFDGRPRFILVCSERSTRLRLSAYTLDWRPLDYIVPSYRSEKEIARPVHLEQMIVVASRLAEDFRMVRVDLYDLGNRVVFGELTFSPAEGIFKYFHNEAVDAMGEFLRLPRRQAV